MLNYIRGLRHRYGLRGERMVMRAQSYRRERTGIVTICHSEYRWRKVRNEHIVDEPVCQACSTDKKLQVHHVKPWHLFPSLRYLRSNLLTLCQPCHFRFGHKLNWKHFNGTVRMLCTTIRAMLDAENTNG